MQSSETCHPLHGGVIAVNPDEISIAQGGSQQSTITNARGTVTAAVADADGQPYAKVTATVNTAKTKVTIAAAADAVAGDYTVTLTDKEGTAEIAVTVTAAD